MAFVSHEQAIERTLALVEGERGETATHLVLLVAARQLAVEVRRLQEVVERVRARHSVVDHDDCAGCNSPYPCPTLRTLDGEA